ncbi:hypothetical protein [Aquimarina aggregata]|uniref:hypothetical protein n=1 Tax=Aquimarina aggregata TaxID=1642818 RepID=UPI00248FF7DB|nr:hypothetical protein [Aquimarina aggregata]
MSENQTENNEILPKEQIERTLRILKEAGQKLEKELYATPEFQSLQMIQAQIEPLESNLAKIEASEDTIKNDTNA